MSLKSLLLAGALAVIPALASAQMIVEDAYVRASSPSAPTGAAFFLLINHSDTDDRLVSAASDAAERVELHTHVMEANGLMRMIHVEEGFPIAAGETLLLERSGNHVMFLGVTEPLVQGETVDVTLTFEHADPVTITIPVDNERQPLDAGGHGTGHGAGPGAAHGTDG